MQFIYDETIPAQQVTQTFKNASWRSLLWVVVIMAVITGYTAIPKGEPTNPILIAVPAFATLFFGGLFVWHLWRGANPRNWLLKATEDGLYINLQSNVGVPPTRDVPVAVFVPRDAIAGVTRVQEFRTLPARSGHYKNTFAYFDFTLSEPLPEELLVALARIRRNPAIRGDTGIRRDIQGAVRVENRDTIRLVWDWMSPRELAAEAWLAKHYVVNKPDRFSAPGWETMDSERQDAYIDTLWEWGDVQDAVHLKSIKDAISERNAARILVDRLG